jgi:hypothetical protein
MKADFVLPDRVAVTMSRQEALVIYELLERHEFWNQFEGSAEGQVLIRLAGALERLLPEVFDPEYMALVERARQQIADPGAGASHEC